MNFLNVIKKNYQYGIILIEIIIIIFLIILLSNKKECIESTNIELKDETQVVESNTIMVDIKGAIKNPGVYQVDSNSIINDQTCPIMIQKLNYIFARKPLISSEI